MPTRGEGDVGYDLYAVDSGVIPSDGSVVTVGTGLRMMIPEGYYGRIAPRSGLAVKSNVAVAAGVVDPGYRGVVKVALYLTSSVKGDVAYSKGDRVAQMIFEKCWTPTLIEADELDETRRGSRGFGSSGV